jgi:hypothetical protein
MGMPGASMPVQGPAAPTAFDSLMSKLGSMGYDDYSKMIQQLFGGQGGGQDGGGSATPGGGAVPLPSAQPAPLNPVAYSGSPLFSRLTAAAPRSGGLF